MSHVTLPAKLVNARISPQIDVASDLLTGEEINAAVSTATVYSGVDANPSAIVVSTAHSGTLVTVTLTGGVAGAIYSGTTTLETSFSNTLKVTWFLAVLPDQA